MKRLVIVLCICLLLLCSCTGTETEEQSYSQATYSCHDIYFELTNEWNYRTVEEMQSTEIDMYYALSRSDWEYFIDEYVLIKDDVAPTFIYCFDMSDMNIPSIDDVIEYSKQQANDNTIYEKITINGIPAAKALETSVNDDGTFYYTEITFYVNDRAYSLFTTGTDELDYNVWLSEIIDSINFY